MTDKDYTRAELIEKLKALGHTGLAKLRKAELEGLLAKAERAAKRKAAARGKKAPAAMKEEPPAKKQRVEKADVLLEKSPTAAAGRKPEERVPEPRPTGRYRKVEETVKALATKYLTAGKAYMEPFEEEDLPERYGADRLTLMAVNPRRLFALWEITPARFESARQGVSEADWNRRKLAIRLYLVGGQTHFSEVYVEGDVGRWHIRTSRSGEEVYARIGFTLPGRRFVSLVSSDPVFVPRLRPVTSRSVEWMTVIRGWLAGRPRLIAHHLSPEEARRALGLWWSRLSAYETAVKAAYFSERLVR
jgi:hypothetical protein